MDDTRKAATLGGRRGVLKAAAVGAAGAAVLAAPNVSRAQTMVLRFQSTWPSSLSDLSAKPLILLNFAKTHKSMKSITYGLTPTGC